MPPWVVPAAIAAGSALLNMAAARRQRKLNEGYLRKQNEYNSPQWQMMRYKQAGLNPALVYQQGNPGNQSQALSAPETRPGSDFSDSYNRSSLAQSQVVTQAASVRQKQAQTRVANLQADVLEKNPYLDDRYLKAVVDLMESTARQKANDAKVSGIKTDWFSGEQEFTIDGQSMHGPAGVLKMETELKTLIQRFDLGAADQKVKAEILKSKAFQNALQEIQLKWLKDADITPQHIFQGIMMLLSKMF